MMLWRAEMMIFFDENIWLFSNKELNLYYQKVIEKLPHQS